MAHSSIDHRDLRLDEEKLPYKQDHCQDPEVPVKDKWVAIGEMKGGGHCQGNLKKLVERE